MRTPLEAMIDKACGYDPSVPLPAQEVPEMTLTARELFDITNTDAEKMLMALLLADVAKKKKMPVVSRRFRQIGTHYFNSQNK